MAAKANVAGVLLALSIGTAACAEKAPDTQLVVNVMGAMNEPRAGHQTTALNDGRLLITGGCKRDSCEQVLESSELFDAIARTFRPAGAMTTPRVSHAAIRLPDGRVLIVGGWTGRAATAQVEIYDPATSAFTAAIPLHSARISPAAAALPDGRVLIAGGESRTGSALSSAEIFDPRTNAAGLASAMTAARNRNTATALADGRVLIVGGVSGRGRYLSTAEVYDPATRAFRRVGDMAMPRHKHGAVRLADGRVMIVGGENSDGRLAATEIFDPASNRFTPGPRLASAHYKLPDAIVLLRDGAVLVAGGGETPEIWVPGAPAFKTVRGDAIGERSFATATLLHGGDVLALGGYDSAIRPTAAAWRISPSR